MDGKTTDLVFHLSQLSDELSHRLLHVTRIPGTERV